MLERFAKFALGAAVAYPLAVVGTYTYTYQRPGSPFAEPIPQTEKRQQAVTQVSPLEDEAQSTRPNKQTDEPDSEQYPNYRPQIVAYVSRDAACLACDRWLAEEMPDLIAAGWVVQVAPVSRGPWPRFRVLGEPVPEYLDKLQLKKLIQ